MHPFTQEYLAQSNGGGGGISFLFMIVFGLICYVLGALPLYKIAERQGDENAWLAFVPIASAFLFLSIAGKEWWWFLLLLIPLINLVAMVLLFMAFAENIGQPSWTGLLLFVPIVGFVLMYSLGVWPGACPTLLTICPRTVTARCRQLRKKAASP